MFASCGRIYVSNTCKTADFLDEYPISIKFDTKEPLKVSSFESGPNYVCILSDKKKINRRNISFEENFLKSQYASKTFSTKKSLDSYKNYINFGCSYSIF